MKWRSLVSQAAVLTAAVVQVGAAPGPIRVSANGRYFVDAGGEPFYFLADTQWELFRRYSLNDARLILENRKAKGFTVVMVMLLDPLSEGDGQLPPIISQLAEGIQEGDRGQHLVSLHPDPSPASRTSP
jgi:hypothetical protein